MNEDIEVSEEVLEEMYEALFERACGGEFASREDVNYGLLKAIAVYELSKKGDTR